MAFDIEKMKADGVSDHLIKLASTDDATFLLLIARRIEHDKLFQQFMAAEVSDMKELYRYGIAAGIMNKSDFEWLTDEENPYYTDEESGVLTPIEDNPTNPGGNVDV